MACRECSKKPFEFLRQLLKDHPDDEQVRQIVEDAKPHLRPEDQALLAEDA